MPYDEFVNLMGNLQKRAGRVPVRVGGNSQEDAILVDSANLGTAILRKDGGDDSDTYDVSPQSFRGGGQEPCIDHTCRVQRQGFYTPRT